MGAASSNQTRWILTNPKNSSMPHPNWLTEQHVFIKGDLIPHDIISCFCQFIGQGFGSQDPLAFGHFALKKFLGFREASNGMVGRFNVCPGKIPVSVFLIIFAFLIAIGKFFAFHVSAIGRVIVNFSKPTVIADFKAEL